MDWQALFLSPGGRIGQKDFWIGALILFVVWVLTPVLHILAPVAWLLLLYPWVCVFAKRLHDFGRSGLWILAPFVFGFLAFLLGLIFGGVTVISAIIAAAQGGAVSWAVLAGALGTMLAFLAAAAVAKLVFILWVGLSTGDPGPNRWGPPPTSLTTRPTPTAA